MAHDFDDVVPAVGLCAGSEATKTGALVPVVVTHSRTGKIMVFARAPVPGKTKTRLIPTLGEEGAARLHAKLIHQTLATAVAPGDADVELWCTPDTRHDFFVACADLHGVRLQKQIGDNLGERMHNAFVAALAESPWAIVIGSDCPDLQTSDLDQAITMLCTDADAVLGPAADGGYVLIGLRRPEKTLFSNLPWGSKQIAEETRARMRTLGWHWRELPVRHDIDVPADLVYLDSDSE